MSEPVEMGSKPMTENDVLRFLRYCACTVSAGEQSMSERDRGWFRRFVQLHGLPEIAEVDHDEKEQPELHLTFTDFTSTSIRVAFMPQDLRP